MAANGVAVGAYVVIVTHRDKEVDRGIVSDFFVINDGCTKIWLRDHTGLDEMAESLAS